MMLPMRDPKQATVAVVAAVAVAAPVAAAIGIEHSDVAT